MLLYEYENNNITLKFFYSYSQLKFTLSPIYSKFTEL